MANPYDFEREALLGQMAQGPKEKQQTSQSAAMRQVSGLQPSEDAGGIIAPPDPGDLRGPSMPAPRTEPRSYMDVLGQYEYGPEGLLKAEKELSDMGVQIQKDSGGRARGRIKLANGDIVDVVAPGEGNDWWNNRTGTGWGNLNRGQEGLDAGGWSFGGGGSAMPPSPMLSAQGPSPTIPEGDFFQRLMAALQQQAGPEATDREALARMLGV